MGNLREGFFRQDEASDMECSLLTHTSGKIFAILTNGLWQTLHLPRKVTARSFVWDAMHVDGVGADRLHGPLLGLVPSEDMLLAGFIPRPLGNIVSLKARCVNQDLYF